MSYEKPPIDDILMHYGMPRRSGRYPWGSGDDPYQHNQDWLGRVEQLRKDKATFTDKDGKVWTGDNAIAKIMGMTSTEFRTQYRAENNLRKLDTIAKIESRMSDGMSKSAIGRELGLNESTIRSLLNEKTQANMRQAKNTAEFIKEELKTKKIVDVGKGVERDLNISNDKLNEAIYLLKRQGYVTLGKTEGQVNNPGKRTIIQTICVPGTPKDALYKEDTVIGTLTDYMSHDGGKTFDKAFEYPASMSSKRLKVNFDEDGGTLKDGLIELRRGCPDLDLGTSHYAQVRILVDDKKYLKGMAVYGDDKDFPDGVDVIFNTKKPRSKGVDGALKDISDDPENPFNGTLIKSKDRGGQYYYDDPKTGKKTLGLINKKSDEGDWNDWSDKIPSQFLAKQNKSLIKRQLTLTKMDKEEELNEILELDNPTVKKLLLKSYADDCDSAAVHLKAASLPRQKYKVILPMNFLKDDEVYAPTYEDGEHLALVRYPHAGLFEIPELVVNNKNKKAREMIGADAIDAVGISFKNAAKLSGADFDGDTVVCIPTAGNGKNLNIKVSSQPSLPGLQGFDPDQKYGGKPAGTFVQMTSANMQREMGVVSNLIMDMTLKGATPDELTRAVKHSMVVIDAKKHKLDYKASERENGIKALKEKYQGHYDETTGKWHKGASTLITKAKSEVQVPKRRGSAIVNKETGEQTWKLANETYIDERTGKRKLRTQKSTKMAETKDARTLSSGTPVEEIYADYANHMKGLANKARKIMKNTGKIEYSAKAAKEYEPEVKSLNAKFDLAERNRPRERRAHSIANAAIKKRIAQYKEDGTFEEKEKDISKIGQQELLKARRMVGSERHPVDITPREWEAIQKGAITETRLRDILADADIDVVRQLATPRATKTLSTTKINKIKALARSGYTIAEIAKAQGVSTSAVAKYIKD